MALDFGMLQPVNIGGNIMAGRQEAQRNQLAQQQLAVGQQQMQTGALTQEHLQLQVEQAKRERDALAKMQQALVANGKSSDLAKNFQDMKESGIPHFVDIGVKGQQALERQKNIALLLGIEPEQFNPALSTAAPPAPSVAGSSAPIDEAMKIDWVKNAPAGVSYEQYAASQTAGATAPVAARTPVVTAPLQAPGVTPSPVINNLTPVVAPVAPVNKLPLQSDTALRRKIDAAYMIGTPETLAWAQAREKELADSPDVKTMQQLGYPLTQAGYQAFRDAQRQERMLSPEEERQKVRIAAASRPPAQPVPPTITQIVDPTNPNQMITIDAKRYQGGGAGSAGVIGVAGKEPGAALRTNKVEQGKTQLADDLENLRASFQTLDKLRAVPSTERGPLSNVTSAIASSRVGQITGQAFATEAQVERDVINSARSRLVNSIKNATGMSAQQLNSNVELQTMLKSISDPGQSYQSAIRIIDDIERAYVTGNGTLPKRNQPAAAPAASAGGLTPAEQAELDQLRSRFGKK